MVLAQADSTTVLLLVLVFTVLAVALIVTLTTKA